MSQGSQGNGEDKDPESVSSRGRSVPAVKASERLLVPGVALLCGAVILLCGARAGIVPPYLGRLLLQLSAMMFVSGGSFLAVCFAAAARARGPFERQTFVRRGAKPLPAVLEWIRSAYDWAWPQIVNIDWRGDWFAIIARTVSSLLALYALWKAWAIAGPVPSNVFDQFAAAALFIAAFPVLVLERSIAHIAPAQLPEARPLAHLIRVPIFALILLGLAAMLRWLGVPAWKLTEHAADVVVGLVAVEFLLRSAMHVFLPLPPIELRTGYANSVFAGLIRHQWPRPKALSGAIRDRLGLDLTRSWALAFIGRAAAPVFAIMALFCWLLTGVTALGINERAVYEAFGRPQAVFNSGLHVHLPWPFGRLRKVEFGVIHEIPIIFADNGDLPADNAVLDRFKTSDIEGEPPESADRLWNADHPSEASYLVASASNERQNFEIANIDLRIVYRIGLSDEAVRDATYNIASPETLIRAVAGRMLARYFARYTITDVLGQNRDAFIRGFEGELQQRLAGLHSGVDVIAVVVEAIHPPAGAAGSYQGVQAAAIRANVLVATARASAVTAIKAAQETAIRTRSDALSEAAERVDAAKAASTLFEGDRQAYTEGGQAFLFERKIEHLDKGLAGLPLVLLDHRIARSDALTLDQRPLSAPATTPQTLEDSP